MVLSVNTTQHLKPKQLDILIKEKFSWSGTASLISQRVSQRSWEASFVLVLEAGMGRCPSLPLTGLPKPKTITDGSGWFKTSSGVTCDLSYRIILFPRW